ISGNTITEKPDGTAVFEAWDGFRKTKLPNGDVITRWPSGREVTEFGESPHELRQSVRKELDGTLVTEFRRGDKARETIKADGTVVTEFSGRNPYSPLKATKLPDGTEINVYGKGAGDAGMHETMTKLPDGTEISEYSDGTKFILTADGDRCYETKEGHR